MVESVKVRDVLEGRSISKEEAIEIFKKSDLNTLGFLANEIRKKHHPQNIATFVIDRNVNYTNVCISGCKFCAFYKKRGDKDTYVLEIDEILRKVRELVEWGGTTLLMQGGINPDLPLSFYEEMVATIKENFPQVQIHCFSAPEIVYISRKEKISIEEVLRRLRRAGLMSIPGGGAEILSTKIRNKISPGKCSVEEWAEVHKTAHRLGMSTTATMMFGHIEDIEDIVEHLEIIRNIQSETGGFTAFIVWTFQKGNTKLDFVKTASSIYYLKVLALSRIFLENIKNIQSSHVTQTIKIGQIGLHYGANDMGSVMIEENVISSTNFKVKIPKVEEMINAIKEAGFIPAQRDTYYNIVKIFD